jgi:hypothetical protein
LRFHGITWDEPELFYAGERTFYWLTHPHVANGLNLLGPEASGFAGHFDRATGGDPRGCSSSPDTPAVSWGGPAEFARGWRSQPFHWQ